MNDCRFVGPADDWIGTRIRRVEGTFGDIRPHEDMGTGVKVFEYEWFLSTVTCSINRAKVVEMPAQILSETLRVKVMTGAARCKKFSGQSEWFTIQ
jgi:hypothetical protein